MRLGFFVCLLAGLAMVTRAEAGGLSIGPSLAFPISAGDIGHEPFGADVGMTLDQRADQHFSYGLDVAYHYWPASPEYMGAYDRYLRSWFQTFDGPTWAFSAIQFSGHLRFIRPSAGGNSTWIQIGAGFYRLDRNLADPDLTNAAGFVAIGASPTHILATPGFNAAVGVDFRASRWIVLGLNATLHHILGDSEFGAFRDGVPVPGFTALTLGTHARFGR